MNKIFKTPKKVNIYNHTTVFKNRKIIHENVDWIGIGIDYCEGESSGYTIAICVLENGDIDCPRLDQLQILEKAKMSILPRGTEIEVTGCADPKHWNAEHVGETTTILDYHAPEDKYGVMIPKKSGKFAGIGYISPKYFKVIK